MEKKPLDTPGGCGRVAGMEAEMISKTLVGAGYLANLLR